MNRRDFLSFLPLGTLPKVMHTETDFDSFRRFLRDFDTAFDKFEAKKLFDEDNGPLKILWKAIVKKENVKIFSLATNKELTIIEALQISKKPYKYSLNIIPPAELGQKILTISLNGATVGTIQFIKL